jgi:hypothetical protein
LEFQPENSKAPSEDPILQSQTTGIRIQRIDPPSIQNGPLPLLKKLEFITNSETLWTKVLKKLIALIKISLKILKKLNKYTDVLQIKSKPHITLLPEGRLSSRGFETAFFQK